MAVVNPIDAALIHWLQSCVQRSWVVDNVIVSIEDSSFFQGGVFAALLWWLWWRYRSERSRVIAAFMSSILAVIVARIIAAIFPFRTRPLVDAPLQFRPPFEGTDLYDGAGLIRWSSFPSDHAVLFLCLVTGVFFVSRRLGVLSGLYALLVVCFPRIYMGIHYPTDILVGAMLGIAIGYALQCTPFRRALAQPLLGLSERYPAGFQTVAFLATVEMAEMFNEPRKIAVKIVRGLRVALASPHPQTIALFSAVLLLLGSWVIFRLGCSRSWWNITASESLPAASNLLVASQGPYPCQPKAETFTEHAVAPLPRTDYWPRGSAADHSRNAANPLIGS